MVHCVVVGCSNKSNNKAGIGKSFHLFPNKDRDQATYREWIVKVGRAETGTGKLWEPTKHSRVCSDHFTPDCYTKDLTIVQSIGYKRDKSLRLLKGSVPTIFPSVQHGPSGSKKQKPPCGGYAKREKIPRLADILKPIKEYPDPDQHDLKAEPEDTEPGDTNAVHGYICQSPSENETLPAIKTEPAEEEPAQSLVTSPVQEPTQQLVISSTVSEPVQQCVNSPVSQPVQQLVTSPVSQPVQQLVTLPVSGPVQQLVTTPVLQPVQFVRSFLSNPVPVQLVTSRVLHPVQQFIQSPVPVLPGSSQIHARRVPHIKLIKTTLQKEHQLVTSPVPILPAPTLQKEGEVREPLHQLVTSPVPILPAPTEGLPHKKSSLCKSTDHLKDHGYTSKPLSGVKLVKPFIESHKPQDRKATIKVPTGTAEEPDLFNVTFRTDDFNLQFDGQQKSGSRKRKATDITDVETELDGLDATSRPDKSVCKFTKVAPRKAQNGNRNEQEIDTEQLVDEILSSSKDIQTELAHMSNENRINILNAILKRPAGKGVGQNLQVHRKRREYTTEPLNTVMALPTLVYDEMTDILSVPGYKKLYPVRIEIDERGECDIKVDIKAKGVSVSNCYELALVPKSLGNSGPKKLMNLSVADDMLVKQNNSDANMSQNSVLTSEKDRKSDNNDNSASDEENRESNNNSNSVVQEVNVSKNGKSSEMFDDSESADYIISLNKDVNVNDSPEFFYADIIENIDDETCFGNEEKKMFFVEEEAVEEDVENMEAESHDMKMGGNEPEVAEPVALIHESQDMIIGGGEPEVAEPVALIHESHDMKIGGDEPEVAEPVALIHESHDMIIGGAESKAAESVALIHESRDMKICGHESKTAEPEALIHESHEIKIFGDEPKTAEPSELIHESYDMKIGGNEPKTAEPVELIPNLMSNLPPDCSIDTENFTSIPFNILKSNLKSLDSNSLYSWKVVSGENDGEIFFNYYAELDPPIISMQVIFYENLRFKIKVHGIFLPSNHAIYELSSEFLERVCSIQALLKCINSFRICSGSNDMQTNWYYMQSDMDSMSRAFRESDFGGKTLLGKRYTWTIRAKNCRLLINENCEKCEECLQYYRNRRKLFKNYINQGNKHGVN